MSEVSLSKELSAMVQLEQALQTLSQEERARVLTWASARFEVAVAPAKGPKPKDNVGNNERSSENEGGDATDLSKIASLAEFYDRAAPSSDGEKALVVGYWFQFKEGAAELDSQKINSELKHLGHGIGNVTRALEWLKAQKPALMIQKRKEGTSQQARKKFMVTNEGKKQVEKMLARVDP